MLNDNINLALELCKKISRANDKFRKVQARQMFEQKLTSPQFGVLEILYKSGPLSLNKISNEMMVTGANITCVVDNLEKEGFVKRIHSKQDRRVILADITESGRNKIESILPEYYKNISTMVSTLSEGEQKEVIILLDKF
ncbi:MAG: MarR family transcriptional regulator [Ignavibacteriales bacterium]|nr:MAG: MarR family transcriptional regulator [Ignavibacteriales bacterium]